MPQNGKLHLPRGTKVPDHVAIIPDGNRRWARARGLSTIEGHKAGADRLKELLSAARGFRVHTVTFWGLSTENWRERSEKEVNYLMKIIEAFLDTNINEAKKEGVKIIHLGRKDRLPSKLIKKIELAEKQTRENTKYIFNIGLDYGGQDEIIRAVKRIISDGISPEKIDKKLMDSYMDTSGQPYPYPDLIIRTSGEQRTSGLLLWQSDYAEMYWEDGHFPDLSAEKLREAILDYSRRRRRFGGNDAVEHLKFNPELVAKLEVEWWRLQKIPEGTRFIDYAFKHLKEQYGLSREYAKDAAVFMVQAFFEGKASKWKKAAIKLKKFYRILKEELKLAFEPELVASLEVKFQKETKGKANIHAALEAEETARELYAEVYRISLLQAAKAAHLRVMAAVERNLAEAGFGDHHWAKAQDYLEKFYRALKERVA